MNWGLWLFYFLFWLRNSSWRGRWRCYYRWCRSPWCWGLSFLDLWLRRVFFLYGDQYSRCDWRRTRLPPYQLYYWCGGFNDSLRDNLVMLDRRRFVNGDWSIVLIQYRRILTTHLIIIINNLDTINLFLSKFYLTLASKVLELSLDIVWVSLSATIVVSWLFLDVNELTNLRGEHFCFNLVHKRLTFDHQVLRNWRLLANHNQFFLWLWCSWELSCIHSIGFGIITRLFLVSSRSIFLLGRQSTLPLFSQVLWDYRSLRLYIRSLVLKLFQTVSF